MNAMSIRSFIVVAAAASLVVACKDKRAAEPPGPSQEELDAMRQECGRIMPKTFKTVWIGMPEQDLITERPDAKHQAQRTDPLERRWFNETSPTGVSVWYGVDRATERLAVVQFAHRFPTWQVFKTHAELLQNRFGTNYELYSCPGATPEASMSRLLWPRQPVGVMEAILELPSSVSVTMLVARVEDLRAGVEKQKCVPLDKEKALEKWVEERIDEQQEVLEKERAHSHGVTPPPTAPPSEGPEKKGEK